jgi:hypothetical protein
MNNCKKRKYRLKLVLCVVSSTALMTAPPDGKRGDIYRRKLQKYKEKIKKL